MMQILQVFYSIFSGIVTALAIPNELFLLGSPLLGIIALIPLFVAISRAKSFGEAGFLTGLQLFVTHFLSSYWLGRFKDFAIFTLGASGVAYFVFGFVFGNYLYLPFRYTDKQNKLKAYSATSSSYAPQQILTFAVVWTIYEWFRSTGFLAYPWGTLVMSAYRWSLLTQIASVTGTWGITFIFALFSAVLAKGILIIPDASRYETNKSPIKMYAQTAALCMTFLAISVFFGAGQYLLNRQPEKIVKVSMIQHNSEPWKSSQREIITTSMEQTQIALEEYANNPENPGEKPDLVVWNESSLGYSFPRALERYKNYPKENPLIPFLKKSGVAFVMGAPAYLDNAENTSNAAVYFDKDGNFVDAYGKIHLVPFAECIPYADHPLVKKFMSSVIGFSNGWTPGKSYKLFDLPLQNGEVVKFTTPICFEDAFSDLCRRLYLFGSELFVNITNDSWSETKSAEYQHFVISSYRTIEHRTSMLRSCTSGYSVVIDSLGRVVADMPLFTTGYLNAEVPVYKRTMTTYSRFGNWMIYVLFVLAFLYSIYLFIILQKEKKYYKDLQIEFDSLPREPDEEEEFAEFLYTFIMKNKEKIYKEFLKMKEKDTNPKKRTSKKKQSKEENNEAD
jgi:apolipoprotein N-acyltransferase